MIKRECELALVYMEDVIERYCFEHNMGGKTRYHDWLNVLKNLVEEHYKAIAEKSNNKEAIDNGKEINAVKYRDELLNVLNENRMASEHFIAHKFGLCSSSKGETKLSQLLEWLLSYESINVTQMEYDLIKSYYESATECNYKQKLKQYQVINRLHEKGYFKNVDLEMTIGDVMGMLKVVE